MSKFVEKEAYTTTRKKAKRISNAWNPSFAKYEVLG